MNANSIAEMAQRRANTNPPDTQSTSRLLLVLPQFH